jgi:glycosyltransferase involved in cell wall biosynthesis
LGLAFYQYLGFSIMNAVMGSSILLIVTVYNRQLSLAATIESILAQTCGDFELVIWDDGSTDESVSIAQQYAEKDDWIQVVLGQNQVITAALKAAISMMKGQFLGWLDSDDLLAPIALAETIAVLRINDWAIVTDRSVEWLSTRMISMLG